MRLSTSLLALSLSVPAAAASAGDFAFGGAALLGLPKGSFAQDAGDAYGLAAYATYGSPDRPLRLRLDAAAEIYGTDTRRTAVSPTLNRISVEQETNNWIGTLTVGPELTLGHGAARPYLHAFGGVGYFATSTDARVAPTVFPFVTSTNYDDTTVAWGGEAGLRVPLGKDWAMDAGVRYTGHGSVSYLAEGDLQDVPGGVAYTVRRSEPRVLEFRLGVRFR
jgi:opacity protein-like surface antigen